MRAAPIVFASLAAISCNQNKTTDAGAPVTTVVVTQTVTVTVPTPTSTIPPLATSGAPVTHPVAMGDGGRAPQALPDGGFFVPSGFPPTLPSGFPGTLPSGFPTAFPSFAPPPPPSK